jgi:hypothetical protein
MNSTLANDMSFFEKSFSITGSIGIAKKQKLA